MKKIVIILALISLPCVAIADVESDHEFLYGYLSGTYIAIGKEPDSNRTYSGKVVFKRNEDHLTVTRMIDGETIHGTGNIEHALGAEKINVVRVRFKKKGRNFEITYLWRNDLDNYARLSGYVYQPGKKTTDPGLEALFIDHSNL